MAKSNIFEIGKELDSQTCAKVNASFMVLSEGYESMREAVKVLRGAAYVQELTREVIADRFDALSNLIAIQVNDLKEWAAESQNTAEESEK